MRIIFIIALIIISLFILKTASPRAAESPRKSNVTHPDWSEKAVIYELNTRQFTPEGTFKAIIPRVEELKRLGVDIIWFMPIHPIGEKNRKGELGSPYAVRDYYGINPEFGTVDDFKSVVKAIHDQGMYVIIDLVANHTSWDSVLVEKHPDWFLKDSAGNMVPPVPDWQDVVKLDYSKEGLRDYMMEMMEYWVKDVGIDGFRCDVAAMVPTSFWNGTRQRLNRIKPVFMLAEAEKPELLEDAFDSDYASECYRLFNKIAEKKSDAKAINLLIKSDETRYPAGSWRMNFITNHDQNSWDSTEIARYGKEGTKAFALLTFSLPGKPLIYNGQEIGNRKKLQFFARDPIEWRDNEFRPFYQKLCSLYHEHPALYRGQMECIAASGSQNISTFIRSEKGGESILVVANLSSRPANLKIDLSGRCSSLKDLLSDKEYPVTAPFVLDLSPWARYVFEMKK